MKNQSDELLEFLFENQKTSDIDMKICDLESLELAGCLLKDDGL